MLFLANAQNHSTDSHYLTKKFRQPVTFPNSPLGGIPPPLNVIWKTLYTLTFYTRIENLLSKGNEFTQEA